MNGRLLAQLACVARADADAIADSYAWPPRAPLTDEERNEVERLIVLSARLSYRATCAGQFDQGTDFLFGEASS